MQHILIIGAGEAGRIIARDISKRKNARVVGFLDDNPRLKSRSFFGAPVLGPLSLLSKMTSQKSVSEVVVAIPSASGDILTPVIKEIISLNLPYRIAPGFFNFETNEVDIRYPLRKIDITDLLGRHSVDLPIPLISDYIKGKTILITGAGGSIGSEICRTLAMFRPKLLVLLGRGEGSLFSIQNELALRFRKVKTVSLIANCTDRNAILRHFLKYKPAIVFHAAAHKHVPFMENNPREAFKNNILGSIHVFDSAIKAKAKRLITLSTDKAVHPSSIMGLTKRITECLIQKDYKGTGTIFSAVRFGNVLGSRGSVIEVFQRQIENGGPLTLTHRSVARYFMTIPEASQLVIMAGAIARQGHIYVLDMGKQIPILRIARELVKLNGLIPEKDIQIVLTGLRPGEKLRESLLLVPGLKKTVHKKIWDEPPTQNGSLLKEQILALGNNLDSIPDSELVRLMKQMI